MTVIIHETTPPTAHPCPPWCTHTADGIDCDGDHFRDVAQIAASASEPVIIDQTATIPTIAVSLTHNQPGGRPAGVLLTTYAEHGSASAELLPSEARQLSRPACRAASRAAAARPASAG
jgi:hypothetical protein